MLRKLLLPLLATAALAGCATDYSYRNGNGDYYYGQPRVEYRYLGPGSYYGDLGLGYGFGGGYGYGATYYYDYFGRLVYGYPGGYRYGNNWYRPPHRGHGGRDGHDHDDDADNDHDRRPPPWRDLGRLQDRDGDERDYRDRDDIIERRIQRPRQQASEAPMRQQRAAPSAPVIRERRERSESPSRSGGASFGGSSRTQGKRSTRSDE